MSIILTCGKKGAAKLREQPDKKKPALKHRRDSQLNCPRSSTASNSSSSNAYMPTASTVVWNYSLDGNPVSIAFCKDNMEVWCNDEAIETTEDFSDDGAQIDFALFSHKARISTVSRPASNGASSIIRHELTIDGAMIPECPLPQMGQPKKKSSVTKRQDSN